MRQKMNSVEECERNEEKNMYGIKKGNVIMENKNDTKHTQQTDKDGSTDLVIHSPPVQRHTKRQTKHNKSSTFPKNVRASFFFVFYVSNF